MSKRYTYADATPDVGYFFGVLVFDATYDAQNPEYLGCDLQIDDPQLKPEKAKRVIECTVGVKAGDTLRYVRTIEIPTRETA